MSTPLHGFVFWLMLVLLLCPVGQAGRCTAEDWGRVVYVIDGDTIVLDDGRHVRYIGIDAPEIDHETQRADPMGDEARLANRQLVQGRRLTLVFDREATDHYGRSLAYCYREDGLFVNAELVKKGLAVVFYRFPNIARHRHLLAAQREAMQAGRGLWRWVEPQEAPLRPYLGNRRSKRFHRHDCPSGNKMRKQNRVQLKNRWEAYWLGYAPHRGCIPLLQP